MTYEINLTISTEIEDDLVEKIKHYPNSFSMITLINIMKPKRVKKGSKVFTTKYEWVNLYNAKPGEDITTNIFMRELLIGENNGWEYYIDISGISSQFGGKEIFFTRYDDFPIAYVDKKEDNLKFYDHAKQLQREIAEEFHVYYPRRLIRKLFKPMNEELQEIYSTIKLVREEDKK